MGSKEQRFEGELKVGDVVEVLGFWSGEWERHVVKRVDPQYDDIKTVPLARPDGYPLPVSRWQIRAAVDTAVAS